EQLPTPKAKKVLPRRKVGVLLLAHGEAWLLERRCNTGVWAGLWSLPEVETDVDLVGHCATRYAAEVRYDGALPDVEHAFTHFRLTMTPYSCAVVRWREQAHEPRYRWIGHRDIRDAALPAPIKRLLL